jgi:hypothetical protein
MRGEINQQKKEEPPKLPLSILFCLLFLWLLEELIASPAPARSQDFFGLLHFKSALAFHFSVSGFAHDFHFLLFWLCLLVIAFFAFALGFSVFVSHIIICR